MTHLLSPVTSQHHGRRGLVEKISPPGATIFADGVPYLFPGALLQLILVSAGLFKMIGWLFPACKSEQGTGCQSPVDHHHVRKPAGEYIKPVSVNCPSAVLSVAATKSKKGLPGPWLASPRIKIAMGLALSPQFRTWHQLTQDRVPIIRYLCLEKFPWHNNHCTSHCIQVGNFY